MKIKLHWQILIALGLAVFAGLMSMKGLFYPGETVQVTGYGLDQKWFGFSFQPMYKTFGDLFLNALKMVVVPLIAASIITSIAGMGSGRSLGRLGLKTISFYLFTSLMAILAGLMMVNLVKPGFVDGKPAHEVIKIQTSQSEKLKQQIEGRDSSEMRDALTRIIPQNVIKTASDNSKMLSLIVFCILFAVFMGRLKKDLLAAQMGFWQGLYEIMIAITNFIMRFAPVGVFGLVAAVVAGLKPDDLSRMFFVVNSFFFTVLGALAIHAFVVIPLILKFVAKVSPMAHFRAMRDALLTAFSTASSSATLPVTLECVEDKAGVSKRTASFVLPLGATVNMDGTALYECVAVIFCAQIFGIDLSFGAQFLIVALALLTSIGVAGIPSASLFAIVIITQRIDPTGAMLAALAIIYIVDRPLDMLRTSVNVLSDSTAAVTVARLEGEQDVLSGKPPGQVAAQNA